MGDFKYIEFDDNVTDSGNRVVKWAFMPKKDDLRPPVSVYKVLSEARLQVHYKGKVRVVDINFVLPTNLHKYKQEIWNAPYIEIEGNVYSLNEFTELRKNYINGKYMKKDDMSAMRFDN